MTILTGPVGLRDGVRPVLSLGSDQQKVINLIWSISTADGGQMDAPAEKPTPGPDRRCEPMLAAAIMAFQKFWVMKGEFKKADGVVDPQGTTIRKLDRLVVSPTPAAKQFREVDGIRIRQTLGAGSTTAHAASAASIEPSSVMPFMVPPLGRGMKLIQGSAQAKIHEFMFEIEKDSATFWIGAAVPEGTTDFTQAHVFFHPATIGPEGYKSFTGRWLEVQRYVNMQGVQMAAVRKRTLLVPFMPVTAKSDSPSANMFASRGVNLIDVVLAEIQIQLGRMDTFDKVKKLGASSFSSGVDYLTRFLKFVAPSGMIAEVIDFDSAHMIVAHTSVPAIAGVAVWRVTQVAPPGGFRVGWLYLPPEGFSKVSAYGPHTNAKNVHAKIGYMMFRTMMTVSAMQG